MERVMRLVRVRTDLPEAAATEGPRDRGHEGPSGYVLERTFARGPACVAMAWGYVIVGPGRPWSAGRQDCAPADADERSSPYRRLDIQ
jgi:hypothetical protein